ncbi:MAG TPA: hypothetical protein VFE62_14330 [Gemmataceae bacterium]|nr:hypothetical protein [Gemmataceae bacterium]
MVTPAFAQTFRYDLLSLLPDDFAICIAMNDLQGNAARWEKSAWLKAFSASQPGKSLLDAPEWQQIERVKHDLKKFLDVDWPTLRDDILGDTLIFAYTPGPKDHPNEERGLILLHARDAQVLHRLIDKLNDAQKKSGELKELTELKYRGHSYHRRVQGDKTQYYFVKKNLAVFTVKDELMQRVLDRHEAATKESAWAGRFKKAGADNAIVTMCVNPRALDAEILATTKKDDIFAGYWRALDAIFLTASIRDDAEVRLSIQANTAKLPKWAGSAFKPVETSTLWRRFPEQSIVTLATRTDFASLVEALKVVMPEKDRQKAANDWKGGIGAVVQLDLFKDLIPNIGPDWGACVLPSKDAKQVPQTMVAIALKPGPKEKPVDQTVFNALEFFAKLAILEHNKNHADAPIRLETQMQGKTALRVLQGDKAFPPGIAPAFALKDGFLILASSPDAIAAFTLRDKQATADAETPLVRISAPELARLLEHRRDYILASLPQKDAKRNVENVIGLLGLFDRVTLSHSAGDGQASWTVRLSPAKSN